MSDLRIIALVGAAHMVSHFLQLALPPLFPLLKAELGVPYLALGLVISVFYAASGIGQTVSGFLVDGFGARPILLGGMTLFAGAVALQGLSPTYWTMLPIAALAGLGNSVFHPADYAIFNASIDARRLARAYSVHGICGNAGWVLAPVVVVSASGLVGWRGALMVAGGIGLAAAVAIAGRTRPLGHHAELAGRAAGRPFATDVRLLLATPILFAFAYFALLATSMVGVQTFGVSAMVAIYEAPMALASGALTAFLLGNAGGILAGGVLGDRTGRHDVVAAGGMLAAAALVLVVASAALPAALLAVVMGLGGFCLGVTSPSRDMLVRAATPAGASGKVFGLVYSGLDLGSLVAPLLYGWLLDRGEPRAMFVAVAALMLVTIVTVVQVRRHVTAAAGPSARALTTTRAGAPGASPFERVNGCQLCAAARITPWYHEDDICWIAECEICAVPMVVWRFHGTAPPAGHLAHMQARLREVAAEQLGEFWVDDHMRNIPDHYHAHGRPRGGFFGPRSGRA